MKELYRLGKCPNDGRYYIRGVLRADGSIDSRKYIEEDLVDGTGTFIEKPVVPEYLGLCKFDDSEIKDDSQLLRMLAKAAGSRDENLDNLTKGLNYLKNVLPKRTNAFEVSVGSTKISLPNCHPDTIERFNYNLVFLNIPISKRK